MSVPSAISQAPALAKGFRGHDHYTSERYELLPIRFLPLDDGRYVMTNLVGDYLLLDRPTLERFVRKQIDRAEPIYEDLQSRHFLIDSSSRVAPELLATQYRTRQQYLADFTALHLFVVTLRCDHSCPYCQVSRVSEDRAAFDMTEEMANRAIDVMLRSPSPYLKVEFQGGEPLLNFSLIRHIVSRVNALKANRTVEFVIATNLSKLTDEILAFCGEHRIGISTSLDGPADLHDRNRPRPGNDSHVRAVDGIERVRAALGPNAVSALMTTTSESLARPEAIIDEYVRLDFRSIFLRWLSPFGFAVKTARIIGYDASAFIDFYKRGLAYIIDLNQRGVTLREEYASLILRKLLTPYSTGYVDLQSPSGLGLSVLLYNYDGSVYASDEARMLAEMGDTTFKLGDLRTSSYEDLFLQSGLLPMVYETMAEGTPRCSECAFQPLCGTDPVFHHATQGDVVGHRPTSQFCARNMAIMKHLIRLLEDDPAASNVLRSWVA